MDGYAVLNILKQTPETKDIPVMFLTSYKDPGNELDALNLGAVDYITKPFSPLLLIQRIENQLLQNSRRKELLSCNKNLQKTTDEQEAEINKLQKAIFSIVPEIVETRDLFRNGHIKRIPQFMLKIIEAMQKQGLYRNEIESLDIDTFINASRMYDIGKIYISELILNKPLSLNSDEFETVKKHPIHGQKIIDNIRQIAGEYSFLDYAGVFAGSHHERWDGSGYPEGLKRQDIPFAGRLMAIVDVYSALVSVRPYRQSVTPDDASLEIIKRSNTAFDPALVEVFKTVSAEFARILA
jgi:putative two-component system response regulator